MTSELFKGSTFAVCRQSLSPQHALLRRHAAKVVVVTPFKQPVLTVEAATHIVLGLKEGAIASVSREKLLQLLNREGVDPNIPVVRYEWCAACIQTQKLLPIETYVVEVTDDAPATKRQKTEDGSEAAAESGAAAADTGDVAPSLLPPALGALPPDLTGAPMAVLDGNPWVFGAWTHYKTVMYKLNPPCPAARDLEGAASSSTSSSTSSSPSPAPQLRLVAFDMDHTVIKVSPLSLPLTPLTLTSLPHRHQGLSPTSLDIKSGHTFSTTCTQSG